MKDLGDFLRFIAPLGIAMWAVVALVGIAWIYRG